MSTALATNGTSGVGMVAIKHLSNPIRQSVVVTQNATGANLGYNTATAFETLQDNNNDLNKTIANIISEVLIIEAAITPAAIIALFYSKLEVNLTTGTTLIKFTSPTVEGQQLSVYAIQDGTGGRLITWDTNFKWTIVDISTVPSTTSLFSFIARKDPADGLMKWFMVTLPLTGQS